MNNSIKLPPLPLGFDGLPYWDESDEVEKVLAYARAAVELNRPQVPQDAKLSTLVERLHRLAREARSWEEPEHFDPWTNTMDAAADAITALRAELAEARKEIEKVRMGLNMLTYGIATIWRIIPDPQSS